MEEKEEKKAEAAAAENVVGDSVPDAEGGEAAEAEAKVADGGAAAGESAGEGEDGSNADGADGQPGQDSPAGLEKPKEPDWKDRYARLLADFDNFKKRTARDREDTYRFAEADILKDILPTVDNLALALGNAGDRGNDEFVKGVRLVYDALQKALKDHGAEPFDSVGRALNPERMEAIATLPSDDVEEGLVSNEVKRGWMLKDRLLRAAQVVVSSGKANG